MGFSLTEKWPRTATGLPSTAGTTATVAFIRHGKMYIGHVGDSGIVLGYQDPDGSMDWKARPLTQDHKPECDVEKSRIMSSGGKVVAKSGVSRVVWTRPRLGHKGPIRRSTPIDEIPFLAVARSLGDLWSYNSQRNEFVVSPEPDVHVINIDRSFRCLVFGTDGLWNVLSPNTAVDIVRNAEYMNDRNYYCSKELLNPSRSLVNRALEKWSTTRIRADNTSVVTILLDPPGGPKRKQFAANNPVAGAAVTAAGRAPMNNSNNFEDWHTMEEECLNSPGGSLQQATRNVEEELDLLNESLYNTTTHQYHHGMEMGGVSGVDGNFQLLPSPSTSTFGAASSHNYEHYQNLNNSHVNHQQHLQPYPRLPPPGGFLQSHLQGHSMPPFAPPSVDYDQQNRSSNSQSHFDVPGAAGENVLLHQHSFVQHRQSQHNHNHPLPMQNLPTFSNFLEDTSSYSLTRLETRMEQLTSTATGGASMYANYQQLIETTNNYCPQVDLNAINTFHDYAGLPVVPLQHHQAQSNLMGMIAGLEMVTEEEEEAAAASTSLAVDDQLSYAMDHEKFAWSQEWHQQQQNQAPQEQQQQINSHSVVTMPQESLVHQELQEHPVHPSLEMPTSSTSNDVVMTVGSRDGVELSSSSIQINEITSSGVIPTPTPPSPSATQISALSLSSIPEPSTEISPPLTEVEKDVPKIDNEKVDHPEQVQTDTPPRVTVELRNKSDNQRRLRQSTKEKENKSRQPLTVASNKRNKCSTPTVATRSTAMMTRTASPSCVSTRKSTAAAVAANAIKSAVRSRKAVVAGPSSILAGKAKQEKLIRSRANLLIHSSKFNQQKREGDTSATVAMLKAMGVKPEVTKVITTSTRRLSKRDKVRNKALAGTSSTSSSSSSSSSSWTVQTRNRIQKR